MPFLTILTGPLGKLLAGLGLAVALGWAAHHALAVHDAMVRDEQTVAAQKAQIDTLRSDYARAQAASTWERDRAVANATHAAAVKVAINADTTSNACAGSRPAAAWIDGMRQSAGGGAGTAAPGAGVSADVRAAAGAAR